MSRFFRRLWCPRCHRLYRTPLADQSPNWCPWCFFGHWSYRPKPEGES